MDEGLIQIIVIGLFIFISMMEGVTRKKRSRGTPRQRRASAPLGEAGGELFGGGAVEAGTSEGLVPDHVWEEIAALARGGPAEPAEQIPPSRAESLPRLPERTEGVGGLGGAARPIPSVGDRPGERARPLPVSVRAGRQDRESLSVARREPMEVDTAEAREVAREAAADMAFHKWHSLGLADRAKDQHYVTETSRSAMLRFFGERGGRVGELRRAILLSEILGPPVSLREDR